MTYVISDLHGYPIEKLKKLLKKANFGENDFLYILGDVIDRNGDGGVGILEWLLAQTNVQLILGNHEAMLRSCSFITDEITDTNIEKLGSDQISCLQNYILNGGGCTLRALHKLPHETVLDIFDYLRDCPLYEAVTVGDKDYILVHAGYENFSPDRKPSDYLSDELIWAEPERMDEYYNDIHTVFGHTPTYLFDSAYDGKIFRTRTWTCIDCGAGKGNEPVLLRLDDNREFKL
ncbi:MAG: calcineurin [Ruminococcaceae bacterium]|nr:calcineurin [Oscillospiraceae bacterium]